MTGLLWSIALAAIGITGLWLAGSQRRLGWALGLSAQLLWIVYGITTAQYGFIASALAYGFVYARNWHRARAKENDARAALERALALVKARRS